MPEMPEMTLDEMRAKLRSLGIPHDDWEPTREGEYESPILERQKKLLTQVRDMLQGQVNEDKKVLAKMYETKNRMQRGGGV
jgi:hypothetical protein